MMNRSNPAPTSTRLHGWRKTLWRRITGISIRYKLLGMVFAVIWLLGVAVTVQTRNRLLFQLGHELETRAIAIARDLRDDAEPLILTQNIFGLYQKLRASLENNPDVRYVFVLDRNGGVLAHSFPSGVPVDLVGVNRLAADQAWRIQLLGSDEGMLTDVAMPILDGRLGFVRVGLSRQRLEQAVTRATQELLLITAAAMLVGGALTLLLTRILTAPILTLVEAARAVGRGDLSVQPPVRVDDEIGELTAAFNAMTRDLSTFHAALMAQNRNLAALNAIAAAISEPRPLQEVLTAALVTAGRALDAAAGWILLDGAGAEGSPVIVSQWGLSAHFLASETQADLPPCHCYEVLHQRQDWRRPVMRIDCPRLQRAHARQQPEAAFACHLSAPMTAQDRPLGVLNIAAHAPAWFSAQKIDLIGAIAQQLGVAVDAEQQRQRVVDEMQRRESLRRQLLERVMTAQEDERRRIARELHDEAGQSLTSLLVELRLLEDQAANAALCARIAHLKALTEGVMEELHRLAMDLRPASLDHVGLVAAVEQMIAQVSQVYGVAAQIDAVGLTQRTLPPLIETNLYRIIQEAVTNALRHAHATHIDVVLEERGDQLIALIEDDGCGFEPERAPGAGQLGLMGMQERAAQINGRLSIESAPGAGATIVVEAPL